MPDSVALGVGLAAVGAVFTGTALVAAQVTTTSRAAYGIAGAVIALAYVLRAVGDVGTPFLTWLSPIGWYQGMHAFSGLRWWPLLPLVAAAALAVGPGPVGLRTPRLRRRRARHASGDGHGLAAARVARGGSPGASSAAPCWAGRSGWR